MSWKASSVTFMDDGLLIIAEREDAAGECERYEFVIAPNQAARLHLAITRPGGLFSSAFQTGSVTLTFLLSEVSLSLSQIRAILARIIADTAVWEVMSREFPWDPKRSLDGQKVRSEQGRAVTLKYLNTWYASDQKARWHTAQHCLWAVETPLI